MMKDQHSIFCCLVCLRCWFVVCKSIEQLVDLFELLQFHCPGIVHAFSLSWLICSCQQTRAAVNVVNTGAVWRMHSSEVMCLFATVNLTSATWRWWTRVNSVWVRYHQTKEQLPCSGFETPQSAIKIISILITLAKICRICDPGRARKQNMK